LCRSWGPKNLRRLSEIDTGSLALTAQVRSGRDHLEREHVDHGMDPPSNFVHETPRAHLRVRRTQHLGCRPSLRLMVSSYQGSYIRKGGHLGGHFGDRSKAGLPTGYW
jgi:hypothetical protein